MARGAGRRSLFFFRLPSVRMGLFIGSSRRRRARRRRLRRFGLSSIGAAACWWASSRFPAKPSVQVSPCRGASRRKRAQCRRLRFLALQHRRRPWACLLFCVPAGPKCPSDPCKGASRREASFRFPSFGLSAHRAGFWRSATARQPRHHWWRQRACDQTTATEAASIRSRERNAGASAFFRNSLETGPASALKSSATRRQRRGCGAQ